MRLRKILRILLYSIAAVMLVGLVCIWGYTTYEQYIGLSPSGIQKTFGHLHNRVVDSYFPWGSGLIHYVDIGDVENPLILFIHGAPGNLREWKRVLSHTNLISDMRSNRYQSGVVQQYRVILVDRLGYGRSILGTAFMDINDHIDAYSALLLSISSGAETIQKPLVVGHSYGGSIAIGMAIQLGPTISGVISVAAAIDPLQEKVFGISYLLQYFPFKQLVGPLVDVVNQEKLAHAKTIATLTNRSTIQVPIYAYHGTKDTIVPFENLAYIEKNIPQARLHTYILTGYNHPLHITNPEIFGQAIQTFYLDMMNK